jgi:hypothetical protein
LAGAIDFGEYSMLLGNKIMQMQFEIGRWRWVELIQNAI